MTIHWNRAYPILSLTQVRVPWELDGFATTESYPRSRQKWHTPRKHVTTRLICFGQFLRAVDWRTQSDLGTWMVHTVFLGHHGWREVLYFPERSFQQTTWMNYFQSVVETNCLSSVILSKQCTVYVYIYIYVCVFYLFLSAYIQTPSVTTTKPNNCAHTTWTHCCAYMHI